MIIYIVDGIVQWLHMDATIKEQEQFINDENCIVIDKVLAIPPMPEDNKIRVMRYNAEKQELYIEVIGTKLMSQDKLVKETYLTVETSSFDNLINMDMLLGLDEKLNKIMEHLGIEV